MLPLDNHLMVSQSKFQLQTSNSVTLSARTFKQTHIHTYSEKTEETLILRLTCRRRKKAGFQ